MNGENALGPLCDCPLWLPAGLGADKLVVVVVVVVVVVFGLCRLVGGNGLSDVDGCGRGAGLKAENSDEENACDEPPGEGSDGVGKLKLGGGKANVKVGALSAGADGAPSAVSACRATLRAPDSEGELANSGDSRLDEVVLWLPGGDVGGSRSGDSARDDDDTGAESCVGLHKPKWLYAA